MLHMLLFSISGLFEVEKKVVKYDLEEEEAKMTIDIEDRVNATEQLLNVNPTYDALINAEVYLQLEDVSGCAKVICGALGSDGEQRGRYD